jgi:hypothetical protein
MQEKHLAYVAAYMGVCTQILCFDAVGREIAKYGDHRGAQYLHIYRQDCHYHSVYKVHCLPASGSGIPSPYNWCDYCCKLVGTSFKDGIVHIQKCDVCATEDAATTNERAFLSKWHAKHQATFCYPQRRKQRQDKFCFVCNCLVDDSDILGACEAEEQLDHAEEVLDAESSIL